MRLVSYLKDAFLQPALQHALGQLVDEGFPVAVLAALHKVAPLDGQAPPGRVQLEGPQEVGSLRRQTISVRVDRHAFLVRMHEVPPSTKWRCLMGRPPLGVFSWKGHRK